jgi:hypothetical protein
MMKHVTCVVENEIPGYRGRVDEIANKAQGISLPRLNRAPPSLSRSLSLSLYIYIYIKNAGL